MFLPPHRLLTDPSGSVARPAVFLDRDGVLNVDHAYVYRLEDWQWVAGAREAVRLLNQRGYWVFVVTNQSGIARGFYTLADMHALHDHMVADLTASGAHLDAIYACPFHPEGSIEAFRAESPDRKPGPGMLLAAMTDYPVIAERSFLIGDKDTDIAAARASGVIGHLFTGGDLLDFIQKLLVSKTDEL